MMLLQKNFYTITSYTTGESAVNAVIEINAAHEVFTGHFPDQPVVPGVCMMQIIKELLEKAIGKTTVLKRADDMKFLAVIDPTRNNIIEAAVKYTAGEESIAVIATLAKGEQIHFKFKGSFQ